MWNGSKHASTLLPIFYGTFKLLRNESKDCLGFLDHLGICSKVLTMQFTFQWWKQLEIALLEDYVVQCIFNYYSVVALKLLLHKSSHMRWIIDQGTLRCFRTTFVNHLFFLWCFFMLVFFCIIFYIFTAHLPHAQTVHFKINCTNTQNFDKINAAPIYSHMNWAAMITHSLSPKNFLQMQY